ncbi:putative transporter mch1 [Daldinia childiae]|nr:putative transporter mch1 [Daldinia childiae]KAF3070340.1 putative transporter mch1 [Daldinia childiae]
MLVAPIASFGLGGMVLSQIGSRILYETQPDGARDINVFHFFLFLCVVLAVLGLIGTFSLRVVDEEDLIDGAVEELERSGLLEGSEVFRRRAHRDYGAIDAIDDDAGAMDPARDEDDEDDNARLKKAWLLNAETRSFLSDHTMWWFGIGFWLIIGPGEAFINNLGTVVGTLYSPSTRSNETSVATHVSIMAAPARSNGISNLSSRAETKDISLTHSLFIAAGIILSIGTLVLASGAVQEHGERFWIVSGAIGAGYGAVFSLTPIIVTMIWGVENFGTNFGILALTPALGSTMWGLIYSAEYQAGAQDSPSLAEGADKDVFCYGTKCYSSTFWAMTISVWIGTVMVFWAWKGRNGWSKRGIVI